MRRSSFPLREEALRRSDLDPRFARRLGDEAIVDPRFARRLRDEAIFDPL
jgi:hypothetical protein